jgi:DNA-binding LacI/PurR family transcriptional regulator
VGVIRFLFEQKLEAPDDVSVIAFDSSAVGEFTQPSLSTVSTPVYEIGSQAFELLLGDVERKYSWPQNRILPVTLLLRESVGAPRAERKTA